MNTIPGLIYPSIIEKKDGTVILQGRVDLRNDTHKLIHLMDMGEMIQVVGISEHEATSHLFEVLSNHPHISEYKKRQLDLVREVEAQRVAPEIVFDDRDTFEVTNWDGCVYACGGHFHKQKVSGKTENCQVSSDGCWIAMCNPGFDKNITLQEEYLNTKKGGLASTYWRDRYEVKLIRKSRIFIVTLNDTTTISLHATSREDLLNSYAYRSIPHSLISQIEEKREEKA